MKIRIRRKKKQKGEAQSGALYAVAILAIATAFAGVMAGGALPNVQKMKNPPPNPSLYSCCDTGDAEACEPILDKSIVYNGKTYALLKSNIAQGEAFHIGPTNQYSPAGERIFINLSDTQADYDIPGCEHGKDLVEINDPATGNRCFGVEDDSLIYICRDTQEKCSQNVVTEGVPFDVYYRVDDGTVPAEISTFCPKPETSLTERGQQVINVQDPQGQDNLQLETFLVEEDKQPYTWLGAWCKPAIYLYPEEQTKVNVQVKPEQPFTITIPRYPQGGWDVTANPDGNIEYQNASYPYLYWESSIPDNLITEPKEGYVVTRAELDNLLENILPKLGLNDKETFAFTVYWQETLPASPYYFVGVIPQAKVDAWAPLAINPKPETIGRVTLYFKTLDEKITVSEPKLTGFERKGFTVTEWGGLFKADEKHKDFTCIM